MPGKDLGSAKSFLFLNMDQHIYVWKSQRLRGHSGIHQCFFIIFFFKGLFFWVVVSRPVG